MSMMARFFNQQVVNTFRLKLTKTPHFVRNKHFIRNVISKPDVKRLQTVPKLYCRLAYVYVLICSRLICNKTYCLPLLSCDGTTRKNVNLKEKADSEADDVHNRYRMGSNTVCILVTCAHNRH